MEAGSLVVFLLEKEVDAFQTISHDEFAVCRCYCSFLHLAFFFQC